MKPVIPPLREGGVNCMLCYETMALCSCIKPFEKPRPVHHATVHGKFIVDCGSRYVVRSNTDWAAVTCKSCLRWRPKEVAA